MYNYSFYLKKRKKKKCSLGLRAIEKKKKKSLDRE